MTTCLRARSSGSSKNISSCTATLNDVAQSRGLSSQELLPRYLEIFYPINHLHVEHLIVKYEDDEEELKTVLLY